jgi:hypothetical protein
MRFFELDEDKVVQLNKPWIQLIPELRKLYTRDKGSPGDYDGRHKLRARRDYTMLYFYLDFNSPIRDWEEGERRKEACYYAGLDEAEVKRDEDLWAAARKYEELLINASPALSTHRALMKTKEKLDLYYATLDFTETDKMGKLLHDPISVANSAEKMDKLYASIKKFAKAAEEELKQSGNKIRGTAQKGENEDKVRKWSEQDIASNSERRQPAGKSPDLRSLTRQVTADTGRLPDDDEDSWKDDPEEDDSDE